MAYESFPFVDVESFPESFPFVDVVDLEEIAAEAGFRLESYFYPRFTLQLWCGDDLVFSDHALDNSDYWWDKVYKHVMVYVPGALDKMRQLSFSRSA